MAMIEYDDFAKVDIRCGRVVRAEAFPEARKPSYKLWIDLGPELGTKASSAQITERYGPSELVGRTVLCAVNLGTKRIAGFTSEVLTLGFPDAAGAVALATTEDDIAPGARLF